MGLLRVGQSEGPQIIQMFGRGVRLKGKNRCLKRHKEYGDTPHKSEWLVKLETLNVFGLKANYMTEFRKYLEAQGIATEWETLTLPVINNFAEIRDLKILKLPSECKFETSTERIGIQNARENEKITLDHTPATQHISSQANE